MEQETVAPCWLNSLSHRAEQSVVHDVDKLGVDPGIVNGVELSVSFPLQRRRRREGQRGGGVRGTGEGVGLRERNRK